MRKKLRTIQIEGREEKTQDIYADIKADEEDDTEEESPWILNLMTVRV